MYSGKDCGGIILDNYLFRLISPNAKVNYNNNLFREKQRKDSEILRDLRDEIVYFKLIYIPKQNYPFCRLNYLLESV